jgi:hypothetical protein
VFGSYAPKLFLEVPLNAIEMRVATHAKIEIEHWINEPSISLDSKHHYYVRGIIYSSVTHLCMCFSRWLLDLGFHLVRSNVKVCVGAQHCKSLRWTLTNDMLMEGVLGNRMEKYTCEVMKFVLLIH